MIARKASLLVTAALATLMISTHGEPSLEAAKPAQTVVANMRIDPGLAYQVHPVERFAGDPNPSVYLDHRVPGGDVCVAGDIHSTGLVFVALNRLLADNSRCSSTFAARQYALTIANGFICSFLGAGDAPCTVTSDPTTPAIVRAESAFKNRATKTLVTFYFRWFDGVDLQTYRITTNVEVPIASGGATKYVSNTTSPAVTLARHEGSPSDYVPVEPPFDLPFSIAFERQSVP
jgi:hypothetical protein